MKKTIVISIVASAMLFGATVDNLTTDQTNKTIDSTVNNALVDQGTTAITGSADVDNLTIIQRGATTSDTGNLVDGVTVNGTDTDSTHIHQGLTTVADAKVNNVTIDSDSSINGGSIDGSGKVSQGETAVSGSSSVLANVEIQSTNTINNADIASTTNNRFVVTQGTLIVNDSNATDVDVSNIDIKSDNLIDTGVSITDSTVKQSYTKLDSGAVVSGLNLNQENTIQTGGHIGNNSAVGQGITMIDEGSTVSGLTTGSASEATKNIVDGVNVGESTVVQNYINIHGGSTVTDMSSSSVAPHDNTIQNSSINSNSKVSQNTYNIDGGSIVSGLSSTHENFISDMNINNSTVIQDAVDINNSTVTNLTINTHNELTGVTSIGSDVNSSRIEQSVVLINNSDVAGLNLDMTNEIRNTDLTAGSKISQDYKMFNGATINSGVILTNTNSVTNATLNGSTISQAELLAVGSTMGTINQTTTNTVDGATINGSTVEQASIGIFSGSDVSGATINATNDVNDGATITNSFISQNHTNIDNSSIVDTLNIDQDNDIDGTISDSTVTQGCVRIGSDSCFSKAGEAMAYNVKTDWIADDGAHQPEPYYPQ